MFLGIQQSGGVRLVGLGLGMKSVTPRKESFLTQLMGHLGVHVPSLSPVVIWPVGLTPMPLGARSPRAMTWSFLPSGESLKTQP